VFHVYVDSVTGMAPDATRALSEAMSAYYGVPAADLYVQLTRGPLRVRANVDRSTAETYAHDLAVIGARVRIEPVDPHAAPDEPTDRPTDRAHRSEPVLTAAEAARALDADVADAAEAIAAMRANAVMLTTMAAGSGIPGAASPVLARGSESMIAPMQLAGSSPVASWLSEPRSLMAAPRVRLATGVVLAIVLGFLPAGLIAALREHRMIDLTSLLIWAVAGSAIGYVWFRKIRWDLDDRRAG
jgi:hypothetical protein